MESNLALKLESLEETVFCPKQQLKIICNSSDYRSNPDSSPFCFNKSNKNFNKKSEFANPLHDNFFAERT